MKRITGWIVQHQVLAFFVLAYAISWPGLILAYFFFPGEPLVEALAGPIVVFSPALVAMLISGLAEPLPKSGSSRRRWIVFVVAWLFAAIIMILHGWQIRKLDLMAATIVFGSWAIFPAWVLSSAYARTPGIRKHFATLLKPRGPVIWYLVIFLIFPGIPLLAMGITRLFGGEAQFYLADLGFQQIAIFFVLEFLNGFLSTGGINEESGWRGFALPRLQARYPVIVAAGIVWFFWAAWHLPFDIGQGVPIAWMLENRIVWNLVFSILMAWLYNRTNGSLLAPALFHPAMNAFGNQFSIPIASKILMLGLAIFAIVSDRMWEQLPQTNPAVQIENRVWQADQPFVVGEI